MSFRLRVKYFLMHRLMLSNRTADELIQKGWVEVDGQVVFENVIVAPEAEIRVNGKVEREKTDYIYLRFNKPRGFQSSLNPLVEDNLLPFFDGLEDLIIAGRLDKDSEGLLLLTNDGKWVEQICNPASGKEKEYIVALDRHPDASFLKAFSEGMDLGDATTRPCRCEPLGTNIIRVVLTEGRNRQIRRMCHKLGANVVSLRRIRIDSIQLDDLPEGTMELLRRQRF